MPELNFQVDSAEAVQFAAAPMLAFKLRLTNADDAETIYSVALRCQIQIEATKRRYSGREQEHLRDLFGEPERWGQTLRGMLWTHASIVVPPFVGTTLVDLPVPCTFDFNVAAAKYFAGLDDDEVPLCLQFSGTAFYETSEGALQVAQISWEKETRFRLPVSTWREMIDIYYPNSAWLSLRRDVFDRLNLYKMRNGMTTWEQALESVLPPIDDSATNRSNGQISAPIKQASDETILEMGEKAAS
jgi:hypothetical protein